MAAGNYRRLIGLLLVLGAVAPAHAQRAPTDVLLDRFLGAWTMTGTVRGKAVEYRMDAQRALQKTFVEMRMIDVRKKPPEYEARVFIGMDTTDRGVIGHWIDNYGAAFSVPHGTGTVKGDTIRLTFPYQSGSFRDTFVWNRADSTWMFRLESAQGSGWKLFAEYQLTRRGASTGTPTP